MTRVATGWLIYRLTHSASLLGVMSFAGQIPVFFLSPLQAPGSATRPPSSTHVTQVLACLQAFALAALTLAGRITIPEILFLSFMGGVLRPSVVPGCNKQAPGTALQRVKAGAWFNTSCFYYPGQYSFGNESRVDPRLYSEGIDNFDFSVEKGEHFLERYDLEFRAEFFNLFNRVQFSPPVVASSNPATNTSGPRVQTSTSQFGQVLSQGMKYSSASA